MESITIKALIGDHLLNGINGKRVEQNLFEEMNWKEKNWKKRNKCPISKLEEENIYSLVQFIWGKVRNEMGPTYY